jgi:hypothetical protein
VRSAFSGDRDAAPENGVIAHLSPVSGHAFEDAAAKGLELDDCAGLPDIRILYCETGFFDATADALGALLDRGFDSASLAGNAGLRFFVKQRFFTEHKG